MSILIEQKPYLELSDFAGANLLDDESDIAEVMALVSQDMEFSPGWAGTRSGFAEAWNPNKSIRSFFDWVQASNHYLVYFHSGNSVSYHNHAGGPETQILTGIAAQGALFAPAGPRLYMAFYNAAGLGAHQVRVWDGLFTGATPNVERAFQRPLTPSEFSMSAQQLSAGVVTAGAHKLLVVFTAKNGYEVAPSPSDSTDPSPLIVTALGSRDMTITLTPVGTWPTWISKASLVMTPKSNPNLYVFVQGAEVAIAAGSSLPASINFSKDDDTLLAGAYREATPLFSLLHQNADGSGPFLPHFMMSYGSRMVYITQYNDGLTTQSIAYISERGAPQYITAAGHGIQLPGALHMTSGFVNGNTLFLCGPSYTYGTTDNVVGKPVEWGDPEPVEGGIGTPHPTGTFTNASRSRSWICDRAGLFMFEGGAFPARPISYHQTPDWDRINWTAPAGTVQVVDDFQRQRVIVMAPLDGSASPTHLLVWDYSLGTQSHKAKYSIWSIIGYLPGAICLVQNPSTKKMELWVSRAVAGKVLRKRSSPDDGAVLSTSLYSDDGQPIRSVYRTRPLPGYSDTPLDHSGAQFWIRGAGEIALTGHTADQKRSHVLPPITGSTLPGRPFFRALPVQSEWATYEVRNDHSATNTFFRMSNLKHYYDEWIKQR